MAFVWGSSTATKVTGCGWEVFNSVKASISVNRTNFMVNIRHFVYLNMWSALGLIIAGCICNIKHYCRQHVSFFFFFFCTEKLFIFNFNFSVNFFFFIFLCIIKALRLAVTWLKCWMCCNRYAAATVLLASCRCHIFTSFASGCVVYPLLFPSQKFFIFLISFTEINCECVCSIWVCVGIQESIAISLLNFTKGEVLTTVD